MKIGIDPGHGGKDPGALGIDGIKIVAKEKDINLSIALLTRDLAIKYGHKVYMTRTDDKYLSLKGRYTYFNKNKVDVAISIHANANNNRNARGCWLIFKSGNRLGLSLCHSIDYSIRLQCPAICDPAYYDDGELIKITPPRIINAIQASGKRLSMIYRPKAKGVCLIETAFISNKDDRDLLLKKSVQKGIAKAIVYGAEGWAKEHRIK